MKYLDGEFPFAYSEPMKIIVFSDTHGNYPLAVRAVDNAGPVDHIIHLGDGTGDATMMEHALGRPVLKVAGNCDLLSPEPKEIRTAFARKNFFITHGDRYNVKSGLSQLQLKARNAKSHVVLYGHTHAASVVNLGGVLFVNPGCVSEACTHRSFALLTITDGNVSAEIVDITSPEWG